ncbi:hypothetical protein E4U59_007519 [Claviceps monticola]|nr:hypothetical protein E4U59_007519 [Claviceps monticola]
MSAPTSALDDHSRPQIENYVQQSLGLLQDHLQQSEDRLAQSEAAREQQSAQLQELNQVFQQLHALQSQAFLNRVGETVLNEYPGDDGRPSRCHAAPSSSHEDFIRRDNVPVPQLAHRHRRQTDDRPTAPASLRANDGYPLADSVQKRLAHYFESGEARGWDANAFLDYLDTLYADSTTVAVARLELHQLRQRPTEPLTEFLVRFEAQLAKADRLSIDDRDKIELLQMALHTGFDKRCRSTAIPEDNYAQAVAAYNSVAAQDRALELRSALRRMPVPFAGTSTGRDSEVLEAEGSDAVASESENDHP